MAEIKTEGGSFYIYTHSSGAEFGNIAEEALLAAAPRKDDYAYATRIVVDQLIKLGRDSEIGFGLMLSPYAEDEYSGDNSPSIVIDLHKWTVSISNKGLGV